MKARLAAILFFLATGVALHASGQGDTLRILSIGNSFSVDAVEQNLHEIAADAGKVYIIGNMYIGGCSLERHYGNTLSGAGAYSYRKVDAEGERSVNKNFSIPEALADENWDVVTFQQSSPFSGLPASYEPWLGRLIAYAKPRVPEGVKFYFHQTWAYSEDSLNPAYSNYGCDQNLMYESIMAASQAAVERHGIGIIPCGTAIQNYRATWYRDNVNRDGYHLNLAGRYIAAATWYCTLSGQDVRGNAYRPEHLSIGQVKAAQESAWAAYQSPFEVTDFGMRTRDRNVNYDLALVPDFKLPDALLCSSGMKVRNSAEWEHLRRPELLALFEREMFGKVPRADIAMKSEVLESATGVLGGLADRKQVKLTFSSGRRQLEVDLLIYSPSGAEAPSPAFLGINFIGNHTVCADPSILLTPQENMQKRYGSYAGIDRNKDATRYGRGSMNSRWPLEMILRSGYALVTFYRGDIDPDYDDGFYNGIHPLFYADGQTYPERDEWGTIAAWSWGLSRVLDYLETDSSVDASKVAVVGHSRLGKAALWAGATDQRFAMVVSNGSGCGGAALSRRAYGETVEIINRSFPHWFCANFKKYGGKENKLPFDQHELLALIAPRPLYVASGSQDRWADPEGEFLSAKAASEVYRLYGFKGLSRAKMPGAGGAVTSDRMAYHLHEGKHDITPFDWERFISFADKFLKK
ncbi:MAG: DUF4886 domain-containing protein [Bacteroidales bacterium]|nr:DUF4886 domain-containing protein [Bacteroidales bacterium]